MRRKCQWQRGTASSFKLKSCLRLCVFSVRQSSVPSLTPPCHHCLASALSLLMNYICLHPGHLFSADPKPSTPVSVGDFPVFSLSQPFSCPARRGPCTLPASHGALLPSRLCASQIWLPTAAGQRGAPPSSSSQFHGIGRNVKNKWNTFFLVTVMPFLCSLFFF